MWKEGRRRGGGLGNSKIYLPEKTKGKRERKRNLFLGSLFDVENWRETDGFRFGSKK